MATLNHGEIYNNPALIYTMDESESIFALDTKDKFLDKFIVIKRPVTDLELSYQTIGGCYTEDLKPLISWETMKDIGFITISGANINYGVNSSQMLRDNNVNAIKGHLIIPNQTFNLINENVFSGTAITKLTIPNNITTLKKNCFYNCKSLKDVKLPPSITAIEAGAFAACTGMTSAVLQSKIYLDVGFSNIFGGDSALANVLIPSGVTTKIPYPGFFNYTSSVFNTFTFPSDIEEICERSCMNCTAFTEIEFPEGLKYIRKEAFANCTRINNISIPSSIIEMEQNAFYNNTNLKTLTFNKNTNVRPYAFYNCYRLQSIDFIDEDENSMDIEASAFYNCTNLTHLNLNEGLVNIRNDAFCNCRSLTDIVLPSSIETIGENSFRNCVSAVNAYLPEGLTTLGSAAFYDDTSLTSIVIPNTVTELPQSVFGNCKTLVDVTIPDSVTSFYGDGYQFVNCYALTDIDIPDSVQGNLSSCCFKYCNSLANVRLSENLTGLKAEAFSDCASLVSINIPDSVSFAQQNVFAYCCNLQDVHFPASLSYVSNAMFYNTAINSIDFLPNTVTTINDWGFGNCNNLKHVTIPENITTIHGNSFRLCANLQSLRFPANLLISKNTSSNYNFCEECPKLESLTIYGENIRNNYLVDNYSNTCKLNHLILEDTASIGANAFQNNYYITTVDFPETLQTIGTNAFYQAKALNNLNLPTSGNLQTIENNAFRLCISLTEANIPQGVTTIGAACFYDCTNLVSISIPDSVTSVGEWAFANCPHLTNLTLSANAVYLDNKANLMINDTSLRALTIKGPIIADQYLKSWVANPQIQTVTLEDTVTIGNEAFSGCNKITTYYLPESLITIGDSAFFNNLFSTFYMSANIQNIGNSAFQGCTNLNNLTTSPTIVNIGNSAFQGCTKLSSFNMSTTIEHIGDLAFYQCPIPSIQLSNVLETIGNQTFLNNTNLTTINLDSEVLESIGNEAFKGCNKLTTANLSNSITSLGSSAFEGDTSININFNLPNSIETIGNKCFYNCTNLNAACVMPNTIKYIGDSAFQETRKLPIAIDLEESELTYIGNYAFYNCAQLNSNININTSTDITIGNNAFTNSALMDFNLYSEGNVTLEDKALIPNNIKGVNIECKGTMILNAAPLCYRNYANSIALKANTYMMSNDMFYQSTIPNLSLLVDNYNEPINAKQYTFRYCYATNLTLPSNLVLMSNNNNVNKCGFDQAKINHIIVKGPVTTENYLRGGMQSIYTWGGNITLEDTITVSNYSFYNCGLKDVEIPESIVTIGERAFAENLNWTAATGEINLPNIESIGIRSFDRTGITSLSIGSNCTFIGTYAFNGCNKLTTIDLSTTSLTELPDNCFASEGLLTSISLPNSITSINKECFYGDSNLASINIPNDISSIGINAFFNCSSLTGDFIFDNIEALEQTAFYNAGTTNATISMTLSDNILTLPAYTFQNAKFSNITINSNHMNQLGNQSFNGCTSNVIINVNDESTSLNIVNDVFNYCAIPSLTLPSNVNWSQRSGNAQSYCFEYCRTLQELNIKGSNIVNNYLYKGLYRRYSINPTINILNAKNIGVNAFAETGLTTINIPETVETIEATGFYNNPNWVCAQINLPNIKSIGQSAFNSDSKIAAINLYNDEQEEEVTISDYAFYNCSGLTSVVLPKTLTTLNKQVFYGCASIPSINIPDTLAELKEGAFYGCSSLNSIDFSNTTVSEIPVEAFKNCSSLKSITFNENIESISTANSSFQGCSSLTSIGTPISSVGVATFSGCSSLTFVEFDETIAFIPNYAFQNCAALTEIELPDSVTTIGQYAFDYCTHLTTIKMPYNLNSWHNSLSFRGCSALTTIIWRDNTYSSINDFYNAWRYR